jgi:hypothetical protein
LNAKRQMGGRIILIGTLSGCVGAWKCTQRLMPSTVKIRLKLRDAMLFYFIKYVLANVTYFL